MREPAIFVKTTHFLCRYIILSHPARSQPQDKTLGCNENFAELPDFFLVQNSKTGKTIPIDQKICLMAKIAKCLQHIPNMPTFSTLKPSKIYPNCDFRFANIPFGNPGNLKKLAGKFFKKMAVKMKKNGGKKWRESQVSNLCFL
jgi:hypothetical protein